MSGEAKRLTTPRDVAHSHEGHGCGVWDGSVSHWSGCDRLTKLLEAWGEAWNLSIQQNDADHEREFDKLYDDRMSVAAERDAARSQLTEAREALEKIAGNCCDDLNGRLYSPAEIARFALARLTSQSGTTAAAPASFMFTTHKGPTCGNCGSFLLADGKCCGGCPSSTAAAPAATAMEPGQRCTRYDHLPEYPHEFIRADVGFWAAIRADDPRHAARCPYIQPSPATTTEPACATCGGSRQVTRMDAFNPSGNPKPCPDCRTPSGASK